MADTERVQPDLRAEQGVVTEPAPISIVAFQLKLIELYRGTGGIVNVLFRHQMVESDDKGMMWLSPRVVALIIANESFGSFGKACGHRTLRQIGPGIYEQIRAVVLAVLCEDKQPEVAAPVIITREQLLAKFSETSGQGPDHPMTKLAVRKLRAAGLLREVLIGQIMLDPRYVPFIIRFKKHDIFTDFAAAAFVGFKRTGFGATLYAQLRAAVLSISESTQE
ncbi:MAG: hypothetical protein A3A82_00210 [Candidatus Pacebacteria bacterium RIFCSPLOWO2_01_FULL_47_12]|nr:MAG: hypothetical protein A3J60_02765 [Candidatus Pacebacteria bacterium RIFCSPHIGHO2_02_FULL_46_9]OGJ39215.1 MAG: hypothetical protein A3A82_00210 [Candidatus Pacebacteria bacterium RIFCSPLOWO2_01_FULL_47_12]